MTDAYQLYNHRKHQNGGSTAPPIWRILKRELLRAADLAIPDKTAREHAADKEHESIWSERYLSGIR